MKITEGSKVGAIDWQSDGFETPVPDPLVSPIGWIYSPLSPHLWRRNPLYATTESDAVTRRNLRGRQGDTFQRTLVVGTTDTSEWTWAGQVRTDVADEAPTAKADFTFADQGEGRIFFSLSAAQTTALSGRYVYDIEAHTPAVPVTTLLAGEIYFEPEVTRVTGPGPEPEPEPTEWPSPLTTGVPAGWTPVSTRSTDWRIDAAGTVIENIRFDGVTLNINANNCIVRNCEFIASIINTWPLATISTGLLIEDCTFIKGSYQTSDSFAPCVGPAGYTARRVKIDGMPEGFRSGARTEGGTDVLIEDCWVRVSTPDITSDWHGDGLQGFGGPLTTVRNCYMEMDGPGTAPFFWPDQGNLAVTVEGLICKGGPFRLGTVASVTGLRMVQGTWGAFPTDAPCSLVTEWEDNWICLIDFDYQPTDLTPLPCT